jgi:protein gp37
MTKVEFHPLADIFPLMQGPDFDALAEDIRSNGLRERITVTSDGKIIDGRNRYLACLKAKVEPKFDEYKGKGNLLAYVISKNLHRRHLDESQRGMVAARLATMKRGHPESNPSIEGFTAKQAASLLNVSHATVERARTVLEHGSPELIRAVDQGEVAVSKAAQSIPRAPADAPKERKPAEVPTFNRTNDNIEWAFWSWNPVTGCKHGCDYCYARDIANRFYPEKFEPTFHPERLAAPANTKPIIGDLIGGRNVFVCSMADLFGKWVPRKWIDAVFEQVIAAPQWNFLFLTKFPQRLCEFEWPENAWCGTTVDTQARVKNAEQSFQKIKAKVKWLSCEPMMERLTFENLKMFDWLVIGGASESTQTPAFQPKWEWVEHLMSQARKAGCRIYFKPNLTVRPKEYPEQ